MKSTIKNNSDRCIFLRHQLLFFENGYNTSPMERKPNRNGLRSKKLIRQAYLKLLNEKNPADITIIDVVREANINRATFYAHYSCLRDLADEMEKEVIDKMMSLLKDFKADNFFSNPAPLLLQVSIFLNEDLEMYKTLMKTPGCELFLEKLMSILIDYLEKDQSIPGEVRSARNFRIRVYYFAGGLATLYQEWFNGKLDCTLFDIPLEVSKMFQSEPGCPVINRNFTVKGE